MGDSATDLQDLVQRGFRFALSLTHDRTRADDLLREAWLAVLRAGGYVAYGRGMQVGAARARLEIRVADRRPESARPRYVAVGMFQEHCPTSKRVAPEFRRLTERFGDTVYFLPISLTDQMDDKLRERQTCYLANCLGLDGIQDLPHESGAVTLIDRQARAVLASARGAERLPLLEKPWNELHRGAPTVRNDNNGLRQEHGQGG